MTRVTKLVVGGAQPAAATERRNGAVTTISAKDAGVAFSDDTMDWQAAGQKLWERALELAPADPTSNDMWHALNRARAEHPDWAEVYDRKQLAPPKPVRVNSVAIEPPTTRAEASGIVRTNEGNLIVNGLLIERPDGWPSPWTRWTMRDAHGNLVVGSTEPGVPAMLILRDPAREEADERIAQRAKELQDAGMEVHEALRMALEQLPLEAKVYVGV